MYISYFNIVKMVICICQVPYLLFSQAIKIKIIRKENSIDRKTITFSNCVHVNEECHA
jgi:hypothetical protein